MFSLETGDSILVVAPHPDDESLGVGGIIWQARQQHIPVSVIFLTNGDGNRVGVMQRYSTLTPKPEQFRHYGEMRQEEAVKALQHLGVHKPQAYFLGLPDQDLKKVHKAEEPHRGRHTKVKHSPYLHSYAAHLPYTKEAVIKAIQHIIDITKPTLILLPMPEDTHNDHEAGAWLVLDACRNKSHGAKLYAYPIHYRFFPKPRGLDTALPLHPPALHPRKDWEIIPLSHEAIKAKHLAVESYISQLQVPLLDKLMFSLIRSNELLLEI